jgi:hypothetical protein
MFYKSFKIEPVSPLVFLDSSSKNYFDFTFFNPKKIVLIIGYMTIVPSTQLTCNFGTMGGTLGTCTAVAGSDGFECCMVRL